MSSGNQRWADLKARVLSAIVMVAVGAIEIWLGGNWFHVFVSVIIGLMVWELVRMLAPGKSRAQIMTGIAAGALTFALCYTPGAVLFPLVVAFAIAALPVMSRYRGVWLVYAPAILLTGHSLILIRDDLGIAVLLWLICVVVASDVCGYFAGRVLGGPKFWPTISPKKTWSGTVAGWIGAGIVGGVFFAILPQNLFGSIGTVGFVLFSMFVAFSGQMGDIAESAIKRKTGVKDSSSLIPGHGGLLDRFDAFIGAALAVLLIQVFL